MEPGASVAEVARAYGLNANQVFKWRRSLERGELIDSCSALLPVTVAAPSEPKREVVDQLTTTETASSGAIHIEVPGHAMISIERGADHSLVRAVLESLRK
jgi:transposase